MKKDITPTNNKGERHGYWEWYWADGNLWYKRFYHNGKRVGYEEFYDWCDTSKLTKKKYHI